MPLALPSIIIYDITDRLIDGGKMHKHKKWLVKVKEPILQFILSRKLGVSSLMAQLLINRGIYTVEVARKFIDGSLQDLHSPMLMLDMSRAVEITADALSQGKKILVYGDYDVDGVTGTALLVHALRRLGGTVEYYIPHRIDEGYGLHTLALQKARESSVDLVITVDCGISAAVEVEESNRNGGPPIIITDHHEPPPILPMAAAVVNPKRKGCNYPCRDLAGVGVAFKLVQCLLEQLGNPYGWEEYLDLVCLGTIADIVPLTDENRIFVRHGLPRLASSPRLGLQALYQVSGVKEKEDSLATWEVGYILAPRINAAGRLGDAGLAVELLLNEDHATAWEIASVLNRGNQERQKLESVVLSEALDMLETNPLLADKDVLVLASEQWHQGVIGIVASRLVDRFYKPVLLMTSDGRQGKGSARSIKGFNLYNALEYCSDCLDGYGGHAMAAGFALSIEKVELFREKINEYAKIHLSKKEQVPVLELDALVSLQDITHQLINEIDQLAPYGHGNPEPIFGLNKAKLINYRGVGKNNAHLKMLLSDNKVSIDGIGFKLGKYAEELAAGKEVNVSFTPSVNSWQGKETLQIQVKDMHVETAEDPGYYSNSDASVKSLEQADDLIFVPDLLIAMLRKYLMQQRHSVPPEMQFFNLSMETTCNLQDSSSKCPAPVDGIRENWLTRLNWSGESILLLTDSACHTVQLFRYINDYNPHFFGKTAHLHGFMSKELENKEIDRISNGEAQLVVATAACLAEGDLWHDFFDRMVMFKPPAMEMEWFLINNLDIARVKALYSVNDWDECRGHLEELAPERKMLASYYTILRSQAFGETNLSRIKILEQMSLAGYNSTSCISLIVAAAIFNDLGLLQYHWQEDMLKYKLMPVQGKKMELSMSPTFNWVHKIKSEGLDWINYNAEINGA